MAIDDTIETVRTFQDKIAVAQSAGEEWVETTPEIIAHYNRKGLGGAKFFVFQGIKVCETGKREAIEKEMDEPLSARLHGRDEGKVLNRA